MTKLSWDKLGVEAIVIVASILLAFSIEALWSNLQQEDDERVVLQSLLDDLYEKRTFFESNKLYNQAILDSIIKLLEASNPNSERMNLDELDETINGVLWTTQESYWDSAPLSSLFSGGNISSVTNQELLQDLSSLHTTFDNLKINSRNDVAFFGREVMPFLRQYINLAQLNNITDSAPGSGTNYPTPTIRIADKKDHSDLLNNQEFQNLLTERMWLILDMFSNGYAKLDGQLGPIIDILENELAN